MARREIIPFNRGFEVGREGESGLRARYSSGEGT